MYHRLSTYLAPRPAAAAVLLALSTAAASTALAQAFPDNGAAVIGAMHERYDGSWYRTLTFTQRTTRRVSGDSMIKQTWKEALLIPGHLRIDIERSQPPTSIIFYGDSEFVIRGDSVTREARRNVLLIMGFDVYRQPVQRTLDELKDLHFSMTPVHSDAWEGHEVYVIGAPKGDLHSRQLWIDRDRMLFVRALEPDAQDSTKTDEYRFDDYRLEPGGYLSETVLMFTDGKLRQKEEYSNIQMDVRLDRSLFAPPGATAAGRP